MNRRVKLATLGVAVIITAALGILAWQFTPAPPTASVQIGMPFKLASARSGGVLDSASLKGQPYGMFFGFTHCPEVCPTTLYDMTKAYAELGDEGKNFRLFFVTVDPERDTAQFLNEYLSNFDPRIEALVPTLAELPVLAKTFRVFYEKVPTSDGSYTMNHTATVFLFDAQGNFASTISYGEDVAMRRAKLLRLLRPGQ